MKRDFLKGLQLSDEAIEAIMKEHGIALEKVKTESLSSKTALEELQEKLTAAEKRYSSLQVEHKLDELLAKAGARDNRAVKALLELDGLELVDGEISGLNTQIDELKARKDYLFHQDRPIPSIVLPTDGVQSGREDAVRAAMGLE